MSAEERCFECNRTFDEVAASGELCAGCFFSFDPDEMSAALNAKDAATRSRVIEYRGPVAALAPTGGRETNKELDWLNMAEEAAINAADHRDEGRDDLAAEWHELAIRRAAIAQAKAQTRMAAALERAVSVLADIANSLHDDDSNNVAHIAHNMSYQLAVIARNTGAIDDEATQEAER